MADAIILVQGIKFHVGFYRRGNLYRVDEADCYVTNDAGELVAQIDDVDKIGAIHPKFGWVSLRFLAEEYADQHADEWDRAALLQARAEAAAERRVA